MEMAFYPGTRTSTFGIQHSPVNQNQKKVSWKPRAGGYLVAIRTLWYHRLNLNLGRLSLLAQGLGRHQTFHCGLIITMHQQQIVLKARWPFLETRENRHPLLQTVRWNIANRVWPPCIRLQKSLVSNSLIFWHEGGLVEGRTFIWQPSITAGTQSLFQDYSCKHKCIQVHLYFCVFTKTAVMSTSVWLAGVVATCQDILAKWTLTLSKCVFYWCSEKDNLMRYHRNPCQHLRCTG